MTCLLDVNVLMALLWENHEQHSVVRPWFKSVSAFATCPLSQLGFARVSSHPLLGIDMTPEDAFGVLRRLLADPRHRFIPDGLSSADRVVRTDLITGANQITDRYNSFGNLAVHSCAEKNPARACLVNRPGGTSFSPRHFSRSIRSLSLAINP